MELSPDLNELLELFLSRQVNFIVVGAHALAFHGVPRFTGDRRARVSFGSLSRERGVDTKQTRHRPHPGSL